MKSQEEVWQEVGRIADSYPLLKCDECAIAIVQYLNSLQIENTVLRLRTRSFNELFVTSDRYDKDESITRNGNHYGVEVMGKVFDNLSSDGLSRELWIADFSCPSGRFILEEVPLSSLLYPENQS